MTGLIAKDFLVFKMRFRWPYRLIGVIVILGTMILFPQQGIQYIALMLPMMGIAFLTEIIKVEEMSDWKDYLPVLPITDHEIVLSRYVFCGVLLAVFAAFSFVLCAITSALSGVGLSAIMPDYLIGIWFAVLMVCFGIPGGYYFKNEMCTGSMIGSCVFIGMIHTTGADVFLFNLASPAAYLILLIAMALMVYISYRISLWIYSSKKYKKVRAGMSSYQ